MIWWATVRKDACSLGIIIVSEPFSINLKIDVLRQKEIMHQGQFMILEQWFKMHFIEGASCPQAGWAGKHLATLPSPLCHLAEHREHTGSPSFVHRGELTCSNISCAAGEKENNHFALVQQPDGTGRGNSGFQWSTWRMRLLWPAAHPFRKLGCRMVKKQLLMLLAWSLPLCFSHLLSFPPAGLLEPADCQVFRVKCLVLCVFAHF